MLNSQEPSPPTPLPQSRERGEDSKTPATDRLPALRTVLAELSGVPAERLDPAASFFELGFDSLALTQVRSPSRTASASKSRSANCSKTCRRPAHWPSTSTGPRRPSPSARRATASTSSPRRPRRRKPPQGFGAFQPIDKTATTASPPRQREFIAALVERYSRKTAKSKAHVQQYRGVHADPRTVSGFTKLWKEMVYPLVVDRSAGCRLWDIDGNEYIDLLERLRPRPVRPLAAVRRRGRRRATAEGLRGRPACRRWPAKSRNSSAT